MTEDHIVGMDMGDIDTVARRQACLGEEPIYCAAPSMPEDIVYSGSDSEQNESTTVAARLRYEESALRFLQGTTPRLLSTSLRGPFDKASGWQNPWLPKPKASKPSNTARPHRAIKQSFQRVVKNTTPVKTAGSKPQECYLPSPESNSNLQLDLHEHLEPGKLRRIQAWADELPRENALFEKDSFWAPAPSQLTLSDSKTKKRPAQSEWLRTLSSKRNKTNGTQYTQACSQAELEGIEASDDVALPSSQPVPRRPAVKYSVFSASQPEASGAAAAEAKTQTKSRQNPPKHAVRSSQIAPSQQNWRSKVTVMPRPPTTYQHPRITPAVKFSKFGLKHKRAESRMDKTREDAPVRRGPLLSNDFHDHQDPAGHVNSIRSSVVPTQSHGDDHQGSTSGRTQLANLLDTSDRQAAHGEVKNGDPERQQRQDASPENGRTPPPKALMIPQQTQEETPESTNHVNSVIEAGDGAGADRFSPLSSKSIKKISSYNAQVSFKLDTNLQARDEREIHQTRSCSEASSDLSDLSSSNLEIPENYSDVGLYSRSGVANPGFTSDPTVTTPMTSVSILSHGEQNESAKTSSNVESRTEIALEEKEDLCTSTSHCTVQDNKGGRAQSPVEVDNSTLMEQIEADTSIDVDTFQLSPQESVAAGTDEFAKAHSAMSHPSVKMSALQRLHETDKQTSAEMEQPAGISQAPCPQAKKSATKAIAAQALALYSVQDSLCSPSESAAKCHHTFQGPEETQSTPRASSVVDAVSNLCDDQRQFQIPPLYQSPWCNDNDTKVGSTALSALQNITVPTFEAPSPGSFSQKPLDCRSNQQQPTSTPQTLVESAQEACREEQPSTPVRPLKSFAAFNTPSPQRRVSGFGYQRFSSGQRRGILVGGTPFSQWCTPSQAQNSRSKKRVSFAPLPGDEERETRKAATSLESRAASPPPPPTSAEVGDEETSKSFQKHFDTVKHREAGGEHDEPRLQAGFVPMSVHQAPESPETGAVVRASKYADSIQNTTEENPQRSVMAQARLSDPNTIESRWQQQVQDEDMDDVDAVLGDLDSYLNAWDVEAEMKKARVEDDQEKENRGPGYRQAGLHGLGVW